MFSSYLLVDVLYTVQVLNLFQHILEAVAQQQDPSIAVVHYYTIFPLSTILN